MPANTVATRRGGRGRYPVPLDRQQKPGKKRSLPEFLEQHEVEAMIRCAPDTTSRLAMLMQWRGGLRVSEACAVQPRDVHLDANPPELVVRQGKGSRDRVVPLHAELANALAAAMGYSRARAGDALVGVSRVHAWRRYKVALGRAVEMGAIPAGKPVGTHTLRHSAARHWLRSGVPVNVVQLWLGHSSLSTTLIYLQLISDPGGYMERVP